MENSEPLVWYGILVILVTAALVLIPYLRGKSDLCTAWNMLLLGLAIFVGTGSIEVRYGEWDWPQLQWFQPTRPEVEWYMLAATVFMITLVFCYYFNPLARAIAVRSFKKWPPATTQAMATVVAVSFPLAVISLFTKQVFFVGLVFYQLSHKALVFSCVFSFMLWYRNWRNPFCMFVFFAVFFWSSVLSMAMFGGRRLLLSIVAGPILCIYWCHVRSWKPLRCLGAMGAATAAILFVSVAYNSIRHFDVGKYKEERTVTNTLKQLHKVGEGGFQNVLANKIHYFGQSAGQFSLLAQHYVNNGQLVPKPLNTLVCMISYPVPHSIWPTKPEPIGETLVRDVVGFRYTNWGIGIPGHGIYEGGIPALILYAFLYSFLIRLLDEPLRLQPTNPYLIAILAAATAHVVTIPRGDLSVMTLETLECFLYALMMGLPARFLFGVDRSVQVRRVGAPGGSFAYNVRPR